MGYDCFQNDGNAASLLLTNLDTGDSLGICGDHVGDWALSLLCAVSGFDWAPAEGAATDPNTGDATDEPEAGDGPTVTDPEPYPAGADPFEHSHDDDGEDLADDDDPSDVLRRDGVTELVDQSRAASA